MKLTVSKHKQPNYSTSYHFRDIFNVLICAIIQDGCQSGKTVNFYVVTLQRVRTRPREQLLLQNYKA